MEDPLSAFDFSTIDDMCAARGVHDTLAKFRATQTLGGWLTCCALCCCCFLRRDPSLSGGHRVVYEREVPFELRVQQVDSSTPQEAGTLEAVRVKLLLLGDESAPSAFRVELTSENDLFFHYTHTLDGAGFRQVQEAQKLMVEFGEYAQVLIRMLDTCIREPHSHLAVFVMQRGGKGHLDFIQNMEYKFVELLSLAFTASDDETVRQSIAFRYNAVKSRLALMQVPHQPHQSALSRRLCRCRNRLLRSHAGSLRTPAHATLTPNTAPSLTLMQR